MEIAVILTCFNRCEKTIASLTHLFEANDIYNNANTGSEITLTIYLTDDGCTDGTANAVRNLCNGRCELHIIEGTGNCFWAGGMRLAWSEALKQRKRWDFYLLLNDDTIVMTNVFDELLNAHSYSLNTFQKAGIYSGITCAPGNSGQITYSGDVYETSMRGISRRVAPVGKPQLVDITNANILLIDKSVVDSLGIFPDCYIHGCADNDYCMMVRRNGLPALVTANVCGECENDHETNEQECKKLIGMTFKERYNYFNNPLHSDKDYLAFVKRNIPRKYFISLMMRRIRLFFPALYYFINKKRGLF